MELVKDVYFIGAGPGHVDLISVRGRDILQEVDVIIYAGSLVSKDHLTFKKESCKVYDSSKMTLDEVIKVIKDSKDMGLKVARLHTGDPTIYGAIKEQMDALNKLKISYEIIPGISSFTAAAAAINAEFTLPGLSQTVILSRLSGRTKVPEKENLLALARHKASMAIFLSVGMIDEVVDYLVEGYGSDEVPIAVIYKATWEDEKVILGKLKDIVKKVKDEGVNKTAQILVGDFINPEEYELSKLYDPKFTTGYRKGV